MTELAIKTKHHCWKIPSDSMLLRLLIEKESIEAQDLCFDSSSERHDFVRQVFLLAASEELCTEDASPLAPFARHIMHNKSQASLSRTQC